MPLFAYNYQNIDIQDLADFSGWSTASILAKEVKAPVIVFCGVKFMAETAAIKSRILPILLPAIDAGCPMADMITIKQLQAFKQNYPGSLGGVLCKFICEVKAADVCCTSSNAVKILQSLALTSRFYLSWP